MATTVLSSLFDNPTFPRRATHGVTCVQDTFTIATTSLDDATDRVKLIPLPDQARLIGFFLEHGDFDTGGPTLDADIVLNDDDADVILFNAGTGFGSARTTPLWVTCNRERVDAKGDTKASLDWLTNVAATTPAAVTLTITLFYDGGPEY